MLSRVCMFLLCRCVTLRALPVIASYLARVLHEDEFFEWNSET
jgi:hypothetical protein